MAFAAVVTAAGRRAGRAAPAALAAAAVAYAESAAPREDPEARRWQQWAQPQAGGWRDLSVAAVQTTTALAEGLRTTELREYDFVHEEDYSEEMRHIAGFCDFLGMLGDSCFILDGVASHVIERLADGQKVFAKKGQLLIEEGAENSAIFFVGHGELAIYVGGEKVGTAEPGHAVGLSTLLNNGGGAVADVRVESDLAYLLELRHGHFMACLDDSPEVVSKMQSVFQKRYEQIKMANMPLEP